MQSVTCWEITNYNDTFKFNILKNKIIKILILTISRQIIPLL